MLTCKEASYLASKKLDSKLTWDERVKFWLHIAMCHLCRHYANDIRNLQQLIVKSREKEQLLAPESAKLSSHAREHISLMLSKTMHSSK